MQVLSQVVLEIKRQKNYQIYSAKKLQFERQFSLVNKDNFFNERKLTFELKLYVEFFLTVIVHKTINGKKH